MLKKFKDVFQSLECSGHIDELLNFVFVEKVSASNDMSLIKINIIAERIIEKKTILDLENLIKDKMFPKKNVKIKIFEKFKLSSQYTAQNLFETYRDSILLEIKNYKISQYVILNNACITFDGSYMDMTVEKNPCYSPCHFVPQLYQQAQTFSFPLHNRRAGQNRVTLRACGA